jgi:hypothetical protein
MFAAPAMGQQIVQAQAMFYPSVIKDELGYTACGLRVVTGSSTPVAFDGSDFSVGLFLKPKFAGLVKVAALHCSMPCDPLKAKFNPIASYQLSEESDGVPVELLASEPGDPPEFTLSAISPDDAVRMLSALIGGRRVQLGVVPTDTDRRTVYAFRGVIDDADAESFMACVNGLLKRMDGD